MIDEQARWEAYREGFRNGIAVSMAVAGMALGAISFVGLVLHW